MPTDVVGPLGPSSAMSHLDRYGAVLGIGVIAALGGMAAGTSPAAAAPGPAAAGYRITSGPPSPGNDSTPTWTFTSPGGASPECLVSRGLDVVAGPVACLDQVTFTLSTDGTHTFMVRESGSPVAFDSATYVLDTAPPDVPTITALPPSPSNDSTPTWRFDAPGAVTARCWLATGTGATIRGPVTCSSPAGFDVAGQSDGTYVFHVAARDAAGNDSEAATASWVFDAPPAAPTIRSAPSSPGRDVNPRWVIEIESGAAGSCTVSGPGGVVIGPEPCDGAYSVDLSGGPDGLYVLSATATDSLGSTSPPATSRYTLDTQPPPAPVITAAPASPRALPDVAWSFSIASGAVARCRLVGPGGATLAGPGVCSSPAAYSLSGQPEGMYTFSVTAEDAAGNTSTAATNTITRDIPPNPPTLISAPPSPSAAVLITWTYTVDSGAAAECRLVDSSGTSVIGPVACNSGTFEAAVSSLADGTYSFEVTATDAGGTSPPLRASHTLDRIAPPAAIVTAGPTSPSPDPTASWSFTISPDGQASCALETAAGAVVIATQPCAAEVEFDLTSLPDGSYQLRLIVTDAAGNASEPTLGPFERDTLAPQAATIVGPLSPGRTRAPSWSVTPEPSSRATCTVTGPGGPGSSAIVVLLGPISCAGPLVVDLTGRPDGTYTLLVTVVDAAGNPGPPATAGYVLDTVAPPAPTLTPGQSSPSRTASPTWTVRTEPGAIATCTLYRGARVVVPAGPCDGSILFDLSDQPDGTYTLSVVARDGAGNASPATTNSFTLDTTAPATPSFTGSPRSPGNDLTPRWAFTSPADATTICTLLRDGEIVLGPSACPSPVTFDLSVFPDGTFTLALRAVDLAGNTSGVVSQSYVLRTVRPPPPRLLSGPGTIGNDATPTWQFATDLPATCWISRGAAVIVPPASCAGVFTADLTGQPDGLYVVHIQVVDSAGNLSAPATAGYTVDRVAPAAPVLIAGPAPSAGPGPSWRFTSDPGTTTICTLTRGEEVLVGPAPCTGSAAYDLTRFGGGTYSLRVVAVDGVGNTSSVMSSSYHWSPPRPTPPPSTPSTGPATAGPPVPSSPPLSPTTTVPPPRPPSSDAPARSALGPLPPPPLPMIDPADLPVVQQVQKVARELQHRAAFPVILLILVAVYLAVQNWIDRRDPKLAQAPVHAGDVLSFEDEPADE